MIGIGVDPNRQVLLVRRLKPNIRGKHITFGWIAALYDVGLYPLGAQQLGLSYEEFLETRNEKGAT